ncbi:MAG: hypothetical protein ACPGU7_12065 [Gammaproteobacteria bacterium]
MSDRDTDNGDSRDNVYAPPESEVTGVAPGGEPPFFGVSLRKLTVMYVVTMGLYGLFWFYFHWRRLKEQRGLNVWPAPRAIFSVFFTHALFRHIEREAQARFGSAPWDPSKQAWIYVVLVIVSGVLNNLTPQDNWIVTISLISMVLLSLSVMPLLKAQWIANRLNGDPEGASNAVYNGWNMVGLILFGLAWAGWLFGLYLFMTGQVPELGGP